MIPGYTTNVQALRPLMSLLDGVLLTPREVGEHLRYSPEQLANLRRSPKGPAFLKLPSGGVRYPAAGVLEWQLSGERGALNVARVTLAIAACEAVPAEHRAAIIAHVEAAFRP